MSIRLRIGFTIWILAIAAVQVWLSDDWYWLKLTLSAAFIVTFLGTLWVASRKRSAPPPGQED